MRVKSLATDHTGAACDLAEADDIVRGDKRAELTLLIGFGVAGNRPLLAERVSVEQLVHALAKRSIAPGHVAWQPLQAPPRSRASCRALLNALDFFFPAHGVVSFTWWRGSRRFTAWAKTRPAGTIFVLLCQQQLPRAGRPVGQLSGLGPDAAALVQAGVGPDMDEFIERPEIAIPAGGPGGESSVRALMALAQRSSTVGMAPGRVYIGAGFSYTGPSWRLPSGVHKRRGDKKFRTPCVR